MSGTLAKRCGLVGVVCAVGVIGAGLGRASRDAEWLEAPAAGSTGIACHAEEPGPRLLVAGVVVDGRGEPVRGAAITAYNTDIEGLYAPADAPDGTQRIKVELTTDEQGRFQFLTVWPASYPGTGNPAHVHVEVTARGVRKDATLWFEGDPTIRPELRRNAASDGHTQILEVDREGAVPTARVEIRMGR